MKRKLLVFGTSALFLMGVAFFTSCGNTQNDETEETEEQVETTDNKEMENEDMESNENMETNETMETEETAVAYACPMHPNITGGEEDKCSECGMALEKVKTEEDKTE